MRIIAAIIGILIIFLALWDIFETIVLPKRVTHNVRFARFFYLFTWKPWKVLGRLIRGPRRRSNFLSVYGPLSMLALLALWACLLVLGFALLHWGFATRLSPPDLTPHFSHYLYLSGTTLFTLGMGDVTPADRLGSIFTITEAATGFGVLALVIGYLPTLYQAVTRREVNISLLDARASSPPSAAEVLSRYSERIEKLEALFEKWEEWAADLLESHMSYPVLCLYRSQHENQSWIASLTTVLDTCSLVLTTIEGAPRWQAQFTFAMARHTLVDLANVLNAAPRPPEPDRLPPELFSRLCADLKEKGLSISNSQNPENELGRLRKLYEPYANSLAELILTELPSWTAPEDAVDNWRKSAWQKKAPVTIKHSSEDSDGEIGE